MDSKEKYRLFCDRESNKIPIFSKDWWLDSVCGKDNWDVVIVEKAGEIVASMPIYIRKKMGMRYVTQPKLTQNSGVYIKYPNDQKYVTRLNWEKELMNKIICQLHDLKLIYFNQSFHYSVKNWLPFYWAGFEQTTYYTYVLEGISDTEKIYANMDSKLKNLIRKAEKTVQIYEDMEIEFFYSLVKKTFLRQGLEVPYSLDFLKNLDANCARHECRKIFYAKDQNDKIHAAIYCIWDGMSAYYLIGGSDYEFRNSQANSALLYYAIQYFSRFLDKFDFEGSMIETIESHFRQFGALQKTYFNINKIYKYKLPLKLIKSLRK